MQQIVKALDESRALQGLVLLAGSTITFLPAAIDFLHGHDVRNHLSWNLGFLETMQSGIFYPQWLPNINEGNGGPFFVFYGPLFSYVTALFSWALGVEVGMRIATFLFWWGSAGMLYLCAREFFSPTISLLAAGFYLSFPYHIYSLYERAALAELAQFFWLPLIVFLVIRICRKGRATSVMGLALCIAAAILTHLVTAVIILYLLSFAAGVLCLRANQGGQRLVLAIVWGLLLAAAYLVPALAERQFINPVSLGDHWNFRLNFLFSAAGGAERQQTLNWSLRMAAATAILLSVFALATYLRKRSSRRSHPNAGAFAWSLAAGFLSVFMMLPVSAWLWELPGLSYVMFPMRWLLVGTLAASLALGFLLQDRATLGSVWTVLVCLALAMNLFLSSYFWGRRAAFAAGHTHPWQQNSEVLEIAKFRGDITAPPASISDPVERLLKTQREGRFSALQLDPPTHIVKGTGTATAVVWRPGERVVSVEMETSGMLELRTFFYPRWTCTVDGQAVAVGTSALGRKVLLVLEGRHLIRCYFGHPWWQKLGWWLTGLALLPIFLQPIFRLARHKANPS